MPYCTQDDLLKLIPESELAELTTEEGEVPDPAVVSDAIALADAEIDSYLTVRYVLPLSSTPARVKALSQDMAIYHLYSRRGLMPEIRKDKYNQAVAFLKQVVAGGAEIIGASGAELAGEADQVVEVSSADRVFSREKLRDW